MILSEALLSVSVLQIPQTVLCALDFQPLHHNDNPPGVVFLGLWMDSSMDLLIFLPRKNICNFLGSQNLHRNTMNSPLRI